MSNIHLRPYQVEVIERLREAVAGGARRILLVAPTGAGKTVMASALIDGATAKGKSSLMVAHRRELIDQAHRKLESSGIRAGTILAGDHRWDDFAPVQVASIQTLHARAIRGSKMDLPPCNLLVIDEAHRVRARTYRELMDAYPDAVVVGLTATPCRGDGRGLGNVFNTLVECPPVQSLIDLGFLVPTTVYAPAAPDLDGVAVSRGDYVEKQLAERMDTPKLVGDIVTHWHRLAESRKTVVFATSVEHSRHLAREFQASGVAAEHIDGNTPSDERAEILARLSRGEITVVSNCMVLTEGWDQPDVSCCVLARPTKHMGLYRQMVGRVLRTAPGKSDALVLDHAGSTLMHGRVEDDVTWTLDEDTRAESPAHKARMEAGGALRLVSCHQCDAIRTAGAPCDVCGWKPKGRAEAVEIIDGDLARMDKSRRVSPREWPADAKRHFHRELAWVANERGYASGWASHKFKERFGHWPVDRWVTPTEPLPETRAWIRSRQIAYAKAKEKAGTA